MTSSIGSNNIIGSGRTLCRDPPSPTGGGPSQASYDELSIIKDQNSLEIAKFNWKVDIDNMIKQERGNTNDLHFCSDNLLGEIQVLNEYGSQTFYMFKKISFCKIILLHVPFSVILNDDDTVTLEYVNNTSDLDDKKESYGFENTLSKRVEDIKSLYTENNKLLYQSQCDLCSESDEKKIDDEISINRDIIKQHKSIIRDHKNVSYNYEISYSDVTNYLRYKLLANRKYLFGKERVIWVPNDCSVVECKPLLETMLTNKHVMCRMDSYYRKQCDDILLPDF